MWAIQTARRIRNWIRVVFHVAAGNWRETLTQTQRCISKRSNRMILNLPAQTGAERWTFELRPRQETCARWRHPNREVKAGIPQHADLRPSIPWESFQEATEKVEARRRGTGNLYWSIEDQRIDLEIMYVDTDECRHPSWTELFWKPGSIQEHTLRGNSEFIRYHSEVGMGPSWRNSECDNDWMDSSTIGEMHFFSWSSDQVDEGQSTCLFRFRSMLGENARLFRSKSKMGKSSRRISTVLFVQRIAWNWWRTDRVRVEYFPRTYVIEGPPEDP